MIVIPITMSRNHLIHNAPTLIGICRSAGLYISFSHLFGLLMSMTVFGRSNHVMPDFTSDVGNFAKGSIDLGGLTLCQSSTFNRVWDTHEGGPNGQGLTFYQPSGFPDGCFMLGHYSQVSNNSASGRVLGVRDDLNGAVAKPLNYTLLWNSEDSEMKQEGIGYLWLPVPPEGYKALGHIVTATPDMPSLDKMRCVRADFTENRSAREPQSEEDEVRLVEDIPVSVGMKAAANSVPLGTFTPENVPENFMMHCLKSRNGIINAMPNTDQIRRLMASYGPLMYLHPEEEYFPSSVDWFFNNGALLYEQWQETDPKRIDPHGENLPQGGGPDGTYWIDLPTNDNDKERAKRGDLRSAKGYLHVKALQGGTITDLAIWVFYPFNGPTRAKFGPFNFYLGKIGTHVGDWEHVTVRINNFDGKLLGIYFAQHSGGQWVSPSELEYTNGGRPRAYASHNGHAMFPHPGLVLQGNKRLGLRNDMEISEHYMDLGVDYEIISADYLGIVEPPWLNYCRAWGPKFAYDILDELRAVKKILLIKKLQNEFVKFVNSLPPEVLGQEGPTGPKAKASWNGNE